MNRQEQQLSKYYQKTYKTAVLYIYWHHLTPEEQGIHNKLFLEYYNV